MWVRTTTWICNKIVFKIRVKVRHEFSHFVSFVLYFCTSWKKFESIYKIKLQNWIYSLLYFDFEKKYCCYKFVSRFSFVIVVVIHNRMNSRCKYKNRKQNFLNSKFCRNFGLERDRESGYGFRWLKVYIYCGNSLNQKKPRIRAVVLWGLTQFCQIGRTIKVLVRREIWWVQLNFRMIWQDRTFILDIRR